MHQDGTKSILLKKNTDSNKMFSEIDIMKLVELFSYKQTLENTEVTINNRESRDTDYTKHTKRNKQNKTQHTMSWTALYVNKRK